MSEISDSILLSTKKKNNLSPDYTAFDDDIISYINAALADLNQIGIGLSMGYQIEDEFATWDEFYTDPRLNAVQTFVGLKVRLLFDPPATSFAISMMQDQLNEMAWRLQITQEDLDREAV